MASKKKSQVENPKGRSRTMKIDRGHAKNKVYAMTKILLVRGKAEVEICLKGLKTLAKRLIRDRTCSSLA